MKKRILFPAIGATALVGIGALGAIGINGDVSKCNKGDEVACNSIIDLPSPELYSDRISNPYFADKLRLKAEAEEKRVKDLQVKKAKREEWEKARDKRIAAANAKKAKAEAAAEAKFKAEGWFEVDRGIYGRWCTNTCSRAEVIGNSSYWLMEVWAKDRAAGDIYAQINVMQNGTVVGWTNDTAFLAQGQKGVLTFTKYLPGSGSNYQAQLVKFNASGF